LPTLRGGLDAARRLRLPKRQPSLTISYARSPQLTASLTKFDVFIDGQKVGRIGNNERERYELPPGPHTISLTIDDFASKRVTIDLRPGENIRLTCWAKPLGLGVVIGFE
jgi:hypothetical protein